MGQTASVAQLLRQNGQFNTFLTQAKTALLAKAGTDLATFDAGTDNFYSSNGWDRQPMSVGQFTNLQFSNESAADIITAMVKAIAAGIFGDGNVPQGATVDAKGRAAAAPAFAGLEELATQAALASVAGILSMFASNDDTGYKTATVRQSLTPGLTLHIFACTQRVDVQTFGKSEALMLIYFNYELIYSFKEAQEQQDMEFIAQHQQLIGQLKTTQATLQQKYNAAIAGGSFAQNAAILLGMINMITANIAAYQTEIDAVKAKYAGSK
ncbi:hypothetical protein [Ferruginibacter sp. HRS2-29]|uniref:hypothetical protein n=1 Tax=Ferruginibacter sp. HRS2-29 TaxID=2487334 RepID=UPI0020CB79A7|nr:hypothetical protein [Ferruginibacter sp. HRS2-29]MCP9752344.1 hypothetical protein [Ferruginibacter sp. HRS2-29]